MEKFIVSCAYDYDEEPIYMATCSTIKEAKKHIRDDFFGEIVFNTPKRVFLRELKKPFNAPSTTYRLETDAFSYFIEII